MGVGSAWLRQSLLRAGIVRRNPVTLSAGGVSYFDVKRAYGVPLAAALCLFGGYRALYVRDAPKEHGLPSIIDGPDFAGAGVFLVDDVLTTGCSMLAVADTLRERGATVTGAGVVVRRDNVDLGFRVIALFEASDLL